MGELLGCVCISNPLQNVYCASLLSGGRLPPGLNLEVVITSIYWTLRQPHIGFGMSKYIQHLCFGRIAAFSGALPVCFQRPHPRVIVCMMPRFYN